jgi:serine/threonine protein phosphatase 1
MNSDAAPPANDLAWMERLARAVGWKKPGLARVPENMRVYAVGDIHGCAGLLDMMHTKIAEDAASSSSEKHIVYLGDFTDRGSDSRGVVDRVLHEVPAGFTPHYIKGNHDQAVLEFLDGPETYRAWRNYGGAETLLSYGVLPPLFDSSEQMAQARVALRAHMPDEHLQFFKSLELKLSIGDYLFVHAGIRPGVPIEEQDEQDLMWIREEFLSSDVWSGKVIVHGHTPLRAPVRTANRISVDTGAYFSGDLSCAVLEGTDCHFLQANAA